MSLVLDCSVVAAWVFADETTEAVKQVFEQLCDSAGWVPSLWRLEVGNVLEMSVRRGRCDRAFLAATLTDLEQLPIKEDSETYVRAWGDTLGLASRHKLTTYDAAYLELAIRRGLPLATLDNELRIAAKLESVPLLGI